MEDQKDFMEEREFGSQPLDAMMTAWGIDNHDMVEVSTEQLNHKQIQRARKGRRLTLKMMMKVTRAFNVTIWFRLNDEQKEKYFEYMHKHLFNYAKGYDASFVDPNDSLRQELLAGDEEE
ncbi:hypothetical protein SAMN02745181_2476 [Rubritalea squalenifaciens DSM 18772]|uniref:Uncharacterized protein n=1 Tax=Rubritalea squalenifaciens DSM 18772 TaxID=1123071 RepID=A0A1M6LQV5_9BACT|nr:hypothetical protein [Rubritalea squalenifaciens]SHJ73598.1 hypothetical protein SAMN02745181_2476 [Rubritalea squalenifaciens DSM 18772]